MDRLLVSGVDTLVGGNLALALCDRCEVLGLAATPLAAQNMRTVRLATAEPHEIEAIIDEYQPHWMVHCGPLAAASWDPPPPAAAAEGEPAVVQSLADAAERSGARLTVVSSDAVFCGPRMFHEESSPPSNPAARAQWVRDMERALEKRPVLIVRTHAYGWSCAAEPTGFAELAYEAIANRASLSPAMIDGRRHATPILATDLAELLWRASELRLAGLYHLAGSERTSPHRFVVELASALGIPCTERAERDVSVSNSSNEETSLSSKQARRALAAATPTLRAGLARFVEQAKNGWRTKWQRAASTASRLPVAA